WGITSSTPGLLAWGWVALILILSPNTSFTKDSVGAKSQLPYASMFTAYKQLWVTLWEEPRILLICQKIDHHVWQSSSSSNIVTPEAEDEDFTSDLMRLALANAGHKDKSDSDSSTTDDNHHPPLITPILPTTAPTAPGPSVLAVPESTTPIVNASPVPTTPTITTREAPRTAQTNVTLVPNALNAISMALPAVP
ncbi:hypothetical protein DFJ58DRAFT_666121, partial [Suillus subalutaceus]|uniref:uncharacterized protein n=1 Tax=Suillus subalutaceus TaxID=48586 RepID=UPI001B868121